MLPRTRLRDSGHPNLVGKIQSCVRIRYYICHIQRIPVPSCITYAIAPVRKETAMKAFSNLCIAYHSNFSSAKVVILIMLVFIPCVYGGGPSFEVASIRQAPPGPASDVIVYWKGGPGTEDPDRWTCQNANLRGLIRTAFDLKSYEFQTPSWMENARFNITAKLPTGTNKEQFRQMQQNLLIERFGFKFHRETKMIQGYELVVMKNGPKFRESVPKPPPKGPVAEQGGSAGSSTPSRFLLSILSKDGSIPPGVTAMYIRNGRGRSQWVHAPMEDIVGFLSQQVGKPVVDSTGLKGKYDLSLNWIPEAFINGLPISDSAGISPPASEPSGPSVFTALQEQLGLKLVSKKVAVDVLVIDHIERAPTEN
jgi:uncharacterized protein (TIGR03435 family)